MTDKPLRILVLFGSAAMFGAERGNLEALSTMRDQGAQIHLLVRDEEWSAPIRHELDARGFAYTAIPYLVFDSTKPFWRRAAPVSNAVRFVRGNIALRKAIRSFRPTHLYTYGQLYVLNFLPTLRALSTPLIYRAGDEPTVHNRIWRWTWQFLTRRVHRFVANSQFVVKSLVRHGVRRGRIHLIYNAPPRRHTSPGDTTPREDAKGPVIGFVGQIAEHKGAHHLIAAFRNVAGDFPSARLAIVGRITDWEGDRWARELRDSMQQDPELASRIDFLGYVADVPAFLRSCAFLVVPSLFDDPCPNVVMEAKQERRAVIGYPRGGIPELIEHDVDGLVCTDAKVNALEGSLRHYLASPELARRHGEAGPASFARLQVDSFAEKWQQVFA